MPPRPAVLYKLLVSLGTHTPKSPRLIARTYLPIEITGQFLDRALHFQKVIFFFF